MKKKSIVLCITIGIFFMAMFLWCVFGKKAEYSESERRVLAKFPEVTSKAVLSGDFAEGFEKYAVDRFPIRDAWRTTKAYVETKIFAQKDNNNLFEAGEHISKLEYPMNREMMDYAVTLFAKVKERYFAENDIYLTVIPDKNRFLADAHGYLSIDYEAFSAYFEREMDYAHYIEIVDLLEADDYYNTDTHWRQNRIVDVANRIAGEMGVDVSESYNEVTLNVPFYGVYVGQSALLCEPDTITYLTSETLDNIVVEGASAVYDMTKADGRDPYEMFLSGNQSVVTMKNDENTDGKRLIIFRDSFASSIAPLLANGYSEIILIDLRYISSDYLGEFVDFQNADILFMYSTLMLNNSMAMK